MILLYQQKKYHIGLQLLSDEIRAIFTYMENVRTIFISSEIPAPSTSPLLDSLSLLDQSYAEPSNKPLYINVPLIILDSFNRMSLKDVGFNERESQSSIIRLIYSSLLRIFNLH